MSDHTYELPGISLKGDMLHRVTLKRRAGTVCMLSLIHI